MLGGRNFFKTSIHCFNMSSKDTPCVDSPECAAAPVSAVAPVPKLKRSLTTALFVTLAALLAFPSAPKLLACEDDAEEDQDDEDEDDEGEKGKEEEKKEDEGDKGKEEEKKEDEGDKGDGDDDEEEDCDDYSEGENPLTVHDGNVKRRARDLHVGGAATNGLTFMRHHNTRLRVGKESFGLGGGWRHSWQYDLTDYPSTATTPRGLEFTRPDGFRRSFYYSDGQWIAAEGSEVLVETATGFEITTRKNHRLVFAKKRNKVGVQRAERYDMEALHEATGRIVRLSYDDNGLVQKIEDDEGRSLQLKYTEITFQQNFRRKLGQLSGTGPVFTVDVPASMRKEPLRYVRLRQPDGAGLPVAGLSVFAPGSSQTLRGKPIGSMADVAQGFDQDDASVASPSKDVVNWLGLEFTENTSIAQAVIVSPVATAAQLQGALLEGYVLESKTKPVLTEVIGSDGQSVRYTYDLVNDPVFGGQSPALVTAEYEGGTKAQYQYQLVVEGAKPMLVEAYDPRNPERAKRIRYQFYKDRFDKVGTIHSEINPLTNSTFATLVFDPKDPTKRTVRYADMREVHYKLAGPTDPLFVERTDSLGRKITREYDGKRRLKSSADTRGRKMEFTRDEKGRIVEQRRNGKLEKRIVRDEQGRIKSKIDRHGRETNYERDHKGRLTRADQVEGKARKLVRDERGRVIRRETTSGKVYDYTRNQRGLVTKVRDNRNRELHVSYDARDQVSSIVDPTGRKFEVTRDGQGRITRLKYPDGRERTREYNEVGQVVARTDTQGNTTRYQYDFRGRKTRVEKPTGEVTTYDYATLPGLPESCGCESLTDGASTVVDANGRHTSSLFDSEGRLLARTNALGTGAQSTDTFTYDEKNNLTSRRDALGRTWRYTYDAHGHRTSEVDPLGRVTAYEYDENDQLIAVTLPNGGVTQYAYNRRGLRTKVLDAEGNLTRTTYNRDGQITSVRDALGNVTRYSYTLDLLTATDFADDTRETREYDALNRLSKLTTREGLVRTYTYNLAGQVLTETTLHAGLTSTITHTYNTKGFRTSTTDALGRTTTWAHNRYGQITSTTLPDGTITRRSYDGRARVVSETNELGAVTRYTYDAAGNLATLTDARGSSYAFTHDGQGRKTAMIYPDGSRETWTYNLIGQTVTYTNRAGHVKTIAYTAAAQPVRETWTPEGAAPSVQYSYDDAARLSVLDNGMARLSYTYDLLNRITAETMDVSRSLPAVAPATVQYRYDALGRKSALHYPEGNFKVRYGYDLSNRMITVDTKGGGGAPLAAFSYDALGRRTRLMRENGVETTYAYDLANQLTDIDHSVRGQELAASHYTLDKRGRRTQQVREDGIAETYAYNAASEVTGVDYGTSSPPASGPSPLRSESFAYDPVGNRTEVARMFSNASSSTETYRANSLNQYSKIDYSLPATRYSLVPQHDLNGNLIDDGQRAYRYDAQNRLIAVEPAMGLAPFITDVRAEFTYDARNRCVVRKYYTRKANGRWVLNEADSRVLTYDIAWNLLHETRLDGVRMGRYVHGNRVDEILLAQLADSDAKPKPNPKLNAVYALTDGLGSSMALTNDSGFVTQRYRYTAYGKPSILDPDYSLLAAISNYRFLFTDREWLARVELNDHRYRYYSPSLGRWTATDPIRFLGGLNLYPYVKGDVMNLVDFDGLYPVNRSPKPKKVCTVKRKPCWEERGFTSVSACADARKEEMPWLYSYWGLCGAGRIIAGAGGAIGGAFVGGAAGMTGGPGGVGVGAGAGAAYGAEVGSGAMEELCDQAAEATCADSGCP
jgi:RHS repeat-associated protein